jgi:hypothetical protein
MDIRCSTYIYEYYLGMLYDLALINDKLFKIVHMS